MSATQHQWLPGELEHLARSAGLNEIDAVDFRRQAGQPLTVPEQQGWDRVRTFASLVAAAVRRHPTERRRK